MKYPDLYEDWANYSGDITGKVSQSGHVWADSGASSPTVTNNALVSGGPSGNYAQIDIYQPPDYQYADISWFDNTNDGVVLISDSRDNSLTYMTHFYFAKDHVKLQFRSYGELSPTSRGNVNYDIGTVEENVNYRVGVHFKGDRFILELPGGQEYEYAEADVGDVAGRFLTFQPLAGGACDKVGCTIMDRRYL